MPTAGIPFVTPYRRSAAKLRSRIGDPDIHYRRLGVHWQEPGGGVGGCLRDPRSSFYRVSPWGGKPVPAIPGKDPIGGGVHNRTHPPEPPLGASLRKLHPQQPKVFH